MSESNFREGQEQEIQSGRKWTELAKFGNLPASRTLGAIPVHQGLLKKHQSLPQPEEREVQDAEKIATSTLAAASPGEMSAALSDLAAATTIDIASSKGEQEAADLPTSDPRVVPVDSIQDLAAFASIDPPEHRNKGQKQKEKIHSMESAEPGQNPLQHASRESSYEEIHAPDPSSPSSFTNEEEESDFLKWVKKPRTGKDKKSKKKKDKKAKSNKKEKKQKSKKKKELKALLDKSLEAEDEIVSETLAKIMLDQGHKEKAIQMFQKLSLLFPEKKAYFAKIIHKAEE